MADQKIYFLRTGQLFCSDVGKDLLKLLRSDRLTYLRDTLQAIAEQFVFRYRPLGGLHS